MDMLSFKPGDILMTMFPNAQIWKPNQLSPLSNEPVQIWLVKRLKEKKA